MRFRKFRKEVQNALHKYDEEINLDELGDNEDSQMIEAAIAEAHEENLTPQQAAKNIVMWLGQPQR